MVSERELNKPVKLGGANEDEVENEIALSNSISATKYSKIDRNKLYEEIDRERSRLKK